MSIPGKLIAAFACIALAVVPLFAEEPDPELMKVPVSELVDKLLRQYSPEICLVLSSPERRVEARTEFLRRYRATQTPLDVRGRIVSMMASVLRNEAADVVTEALGPDQPWQIRSRAFSVIQSDWAYGNLPESFLPPLRAALNESDIVTLTDVLRILSNHPDPALNCGRLFEIIRTQANKEPLKSEVDLPDKPGFSSEVLTSAIDVAKNAGEKRLAGVLAELLLHPRRNIWTLALGKLDGLAKDFLPEQMPRIINRLAELLTDHSAVVRQQAAEVLAALDDPRGTGILLKCEDVRALSRLCQKPWNEKFNRNFDADNPDDVRDKAALLAEIESWLKKAGYSTVPPPRPVRKLSDEERKLFTQLPDYGLFDLAKNPGTRRVHANSAFLGIYEQIIKGEVEGWLIPAANGGRAEMVLDSQMRVDVLQIIDTIDFVAEAKKKIDEIEKSDGAISNANFSFYSNKEPSDPVYTAIFWAVWLRQLGEGDLADRLLNLALAGVNDYAEFHEELRFEFTWQPAYTAARCFRFGEDQRALALAENAARMLKTLTPYSLYDYGANYGVATNEKLLEDLKRRKDAGRLRKITTSPPADFETWPLEKRIAWAIDWLDDIQPTGAEYPAEVETSAQVRLLVKLGEAAVPALIDCIDKDTRLTRWVRTSGGEGQISWTCISVQEAASAAISEILNFSTFGSPENPHPGQSLRDYWQRYGRLPQVERLMLHLTDAQLRPEVREDAASRLAHFGETSPLVPQLGRPFRHTERKGMNPELLRFKNPTVAEAILGLMDRRLTKFDATNTLNGENSTQYLYERTRLEDTFIFLFADLQDSRIVPVLEKRFKNASDSLLRVKLAYIMHRLGNSKPLQQFSSAFERGRLDLPQLPGVGRGIQDQFEGVILLRIIAWLSQCRAESADKALVALADKAHPLHALTVDQAFKVNDGELDKVQYGNRFCFEFLRADLDDLALDGKTYAIVGKHLERDQPGLHVRDGIPSFLADPANRKESAQGRCCDQAAVQLSNLILGSPEFHPLLKNADARIAEWRAFLDTYRSRLRALDLTERDAMGISWVESPQYIVDMPPLNRAANAQDVAERRAIFHLNGKGRLTEMKLPSTAIFAKDKDEQYPDHVLILQAEVDENGKTILGIVSRHETRSILSDELINIRPLQ